MHTRKVVKVDNGLHFGLHDAEYREIDAVANSDLTLVKKSPAHFKAGVRKDSAAFKIGTAGHHAILQPSLYERLYGVLPAGDGRTKAIKDAKAALIQTFGAEHVLTYAEDQMCNGMAASVFAHDVARPLIHCDGDAEVAAVWEDPRSGLKCKGLLDKYPDDSDMIVDLKTTADASPKAFAKSLYSYGYHRQAAHYLRGVQTIGEPRTKFIFVAVEKTPPYAIGVYRISDAALQAGVDELDQLLDTYARCESTGVWPGYPEGITEITLPTWYWSDIENNNNIVE